MDDDLAGREILKRVYDAIPDGADVDDVCRVLTGILAGTVRRYYAEGEQRQRVLEKVISNLLEYTVGDAASRMELH